jgi:predicted GNAT family acetyltransferase
MSEKSSSTMGAVIDNESNNRFEIEVDGELACATYTLRDGTITFIHTFVPESLRGRGIATRIVIAALDSSRARGLKVVPRCPLFRAYMTRHLETRDLLAPEGLALISA